MRRVSIFVLFLIVCICSFWRIDSPYLWNDEGDTVFLGRTVGLYGVPKATDGRNANSYYNCIQLDRDFNSRRIPWFQYYVSFVSQKIFGESTAGSRVLFVFFGALSFWPIGLLLQRWQFGWGFAAIAMLLPQTILFNRNARYFSLLNFETALLFWLVLGVDHPRKYIAIGVVSVLMFFTHPLAAILTVGSLSAYYLLRERHQFIKKNIVLWLGLPIWLLWYLSTEGFRDRFSGTLLISKLTTATSFWFQTMLKNILISISDLDFVGSITFLSWLILGAALLWLKRKNKKLDSLPFVILLFSLFSIIGLGGVSMPERFDEELLSPLRYMPAVCLLLPVALFVTLSQFKLKTPAKVCLLIVLFFTNTLSAGYWTRNSPFSWWPPVYKEILFGSPDQIKIAVDTVRSLGLPKDALLEIIPPAIEPNMIVYLGEDYLIKLFDRDMPPDCKVAVENAIGIAQLTKLSGLPHLTLKMPDKVFSPFIKPSRQKVAKVITIPMHTPHFDGARPELTRHDFANAKTVQSTIEITVYEK